jgi:hypothetical protein
MTMTTRHQKCTNCGWPGLTWDEARRSYRRMVQNGLTIEGKRGKSRGDGKIIRFSRHRESDSLWECRLPQTLTAFRPLI